MKDYQTHPQGKHGIEKVYDYHDPGGKLLFQVVRTRPKGFYIRTPDGRGGHVNKLNGVETVLYRLPEILKSKEVILCEGEKDVDNLVALGFLNATTAPMGAGKWKRGYTEALKGKGAYIFPDHDQPGRDHAKLIMEALNGVAAFVKVITLPDLPEGGDVTDFLTRFKTKDEAVEVLSELMSQTPVVTRDDLYNNSHDNIHEDPRFVTGNVTPEESDSVTKVVTAYLDKDPNSWSCADFSDYFQSLPVLPKPREIYLDLGIRDKAAQLRCRVAQHRDLERGKLIKDGSIIRPKLPTGSALAYWQDDAKGYIDLRWPGGLERYIRMKHGQCALLAGSQNAGKTVFALRFIALNMDRYKGRIRLITSEDREGLTAAFEAFASVKDPALHVPFMKWAECIDIRYLENERERDYFYDLVEPDMITVLDYLKLYDQFWKISEKIDRAVDKLGKGFLFLNLQLDLFKNPDPKIPRPGRGQTFGIEAPRLYLTMQKKPEDVTGWLHILKAKIPRDSKYVIEGARCEYEVRMGAKIVWNTPWIGIKSKST